MVLYKSSGGSLFASIRASHKWLLKSSGDCFCSHDRRAGCSNDQPWQVGCKSVGCNSFPALLMLVCCQLAYDVLLLGGMLWRTSLDVIVTGYKQGSAVPIANLMFVVVMSPH